MLSAFQHQARSCHLRGVMCHVRFLSDKGGQHPLNPSQKREKKALCEIKTANNLLSLPVWRWHGNRASASLALKLWRARLYNLHCFLVSSRCWHNCRRVTPPFEACSTVKRPVCFQDDLGGRLTVVFLSSDGAGRRVITQSDDNDNRGVFLTS